MSIPVVSSRAPPVSSESCETQTERVSLAVLESLGLSPRVETLPTLQMAKTHVRWLSASFECAFQSTGVPLLSAGVLGQGN